MAGGRVGRSAAPPCPEAASVVRSKAGSSGHGAKAARTGFKARSLNNGLKAQSHPRPAV